MATMVTVHMNVVMGPGRAIVANGFVGKKQLPGAATTRLVQSSSKSADGNSISLRATTRSEVMRAMSGAPET